MGNFEHDERATVRVVASSKVTILKFMGIRGWMRILRRQRHILKRIIRQ